MNKKQKAYQHALDVLEHRHQINRLFCSDVCCTPASHYTSDGDCNIEGTSKCPQADNLKTKSKEYQQLQQLIDTHFDTKLSTIPLTTIGIPTDIFLSILTDTHIVWVCDYCDVCGYEINGFDGKNFHSTNHCHGVHMADIIFKPQDYNQYWFYTEDDARQALVRKCTIDASDTSNT